MPSWPRVERYEVRPPGARRPRPARPGSSTPCGRGRRSWWSTPRATSSRSCPARATPTRSTPLVDELVGRARGARARCTAATGPYVAAASRGRPTLRFPGKACVLPDRHPARRRLGPPPAGRAGRATARRVLRRIGTGARGLVDGAPGGGAVQRAATGCAAAAGRASRRRWATTCVVADTVNHALRGVRLADGAVTTVAGTGAAVDAGRAEQRPGDARWRCRRPWDVAWSRRRGSWWRWPASTSSGPSTRSARDDGAVRRHDQRGAASTAPAERGLVRPDLGPGRSADGDDGCGSSTPRPRRCGAVAPDGVVHTDVGTGLFDFGHVDGPAADGAAAAPARGDRAARRLGRGQPTPTTARCAASTRRPAR